MSPGEAGLLLYMNTIFRKVDISGKSALTFTSPLWIESWGWGEATHAMDPVLAVLDSSPGSLIPGISDAH